MSPDLVRRRRVVLATLSLGVVVMVVFDHWFTLLLGIVLMLGSVIAGVFLVALPGGFLDHDQGDEQAKERPTTMHSDASEREDQL